MRAIAASEADVKRIVMRDVQTYCGVLFDDNNRKPICRLYLNGKKWQIGLFSEERAETRHPLASSTDIYQHTEAIRSAIRRYLPKEGEAQSQTAESSKVGGA